MNQNHQYQIYNFNISPQLINTIKKNFSSDYQKQFHPHNLYHVLQTLSQIYHQTNQQKQKTLFQHAHNKTNSQTQKQMILWYINQRKNKYTFSLEQQYQNYPQIICLNPDYLKHTHNQNTPFNTKLNQQFTLTPLYINHFYYYVQKIIVKAKLKRPENQQLNKKYQPQSFQKYYLLNSKFQKQFQTSPWIVQPTRDGRFVWRGDIALDKNDLLHLLQFILTKRSQSNQCPSILINAGSHGQSNGLNAADLGKRQLTDLKIYFQTKQNISKLISQDKYLLTKQNARNKIYIHMLSSNTASNYSKYADHIIDVQCFGAFSQIDNEYLRTKNEKKQQNRQKCLQFLYNEPPIQISSIVYEIPFNKLLNKFRQKNNCSDIIKSIKSVRNVIKLIPFKIWNVQLLYKEGQVFDRQKYRDNCQDQKSTLIISTTQDNKILLIYNGGRFKNSKKGQFLNEFKSLSHNELSISVFFLGDEQLFGIQQLPINILLDESFRFVVFRKHKFSIYNSLSQNIQNQFIQSISLKLNLNKVELQANKNKQSQNINSHQYHIKQQKQNICFIKNGQYEQLLKIKHFQVWKIQKDQ